MKDVRVIEFAPKMRQPGWWGWKRHWATAKIVMMTITEDEAKNELAWGEVWEKMLKEDHVNMKFIVIPNGVFLPVPAKHYNP